MVAHAGNAVRNAGFLHQTDEMPGQHFARVVLRGAACFRAQPRRAVKVTLGARGGRKAEHRWRVHDHRHTVRHDSLFLRVARGTELAHQSRHRIRHAVRHMHAGIAESNPGERRRVHHVVARLGVGGVVHRPHEIPAQQLECALAAEVAPGICSLAHGPQRRALGPGTAGVGPRGIGLQRMREHIEPARRDDLLRQRVGGGWIDERERRPQAARGDACFHLHRKQIENRDPGAFRTGAAGGWAGDVGFQRTRHRFARADRGVHVGEKIGRPGGVKVGRLAGIDDRAAAERNVAVERPAGGEARRIEKRFVGRFDLYLVVDGDSQAGVAQRIEGAGKERQFADALVGEQRHARHAQRSGVLTKFGQHPGPEHDARGVDRERAFPALGNGVVMTAAHLRFLLPCLRTRLL